MQNTALLALASLTVASGSSDGVARDTHPHRGIACEIAGPQAGEPVTRPCLPDGRTIRTRRCYPVLTLGSARCDEGKQ